MTKHKSLRTKVGLYSVIKAEGRPMGVDRQTQGRHALPLRVRHTALETCEDRVPWL